MRLHGLEYNREVKHGMWPTAASTPSVRSQRRDIYAELIRRVGMAVYALGNVCVKDKCINNAFDNYSNCLSLYEERYLSSFVLEIGMSL
jgi:hypothetical protein